MGKFFIACDFIIIDMKEDYIPIIIVRPFFVTTEATIAVKNDRCSL